MGRPIKAKFFGNLNLPYYGSEQLGSGVGGEGFSTVAVSNTGSNYSTATSYTWTASAPQVAGGVAASGTVTVAGNGGVSAFNVTTAGSGYTSTGSVTITISPASTGTTATGVISLTSNRQNALRIVSYIPTGSSAITGGDIVKQEASRRYLVKNAQGTGQCKLVAKDSGTMVAGDMNIVATDTLGSTYWVLKLTARRAVLSRRTDGGSGYEFATGARAGWTLGSASSGVVTLASD